VHFTILYTICLNFGVAAQYMKKIFNCMVGIEILRGVDLGYIESGCGAFGFHGEGQNNGTTSIADLLTYNLSPIANIIRNGDKSIQRGGIKSPLNHA
jgi:hypothetical protein